MADYRREYHMTPADLRGLSLREFMWLLQGLSEHSRFAAAWEKHPKNVYDPDEIAAITAAARR